MYDGGGYAKGGGGSGGKARALYDFTGQTPTDLSFRKGDVISIVSTQSNSGPEWWYGELKGKKGDFPHNHVERMNDIAVAPSASSYAPQSYAPQPYSPQPQSYAPQSYSPQPYGGGAAAYSPAPYGGSSGYNPDPAPTSMDTSANQKPPKSSSGGGSSSFSGSGGEGGKFGMIFFGVHMANLVCSGLSLILPWYCNYVAQKFGVRTWQWLGISESTLGKVNSFFPPPSLSAGYRPYPSLNYPNMGSVLIVTFIFMLIATVIAFVTTCWAHMYRTEKYPGTMRKYVIGSGINAIASIIGFCQFFRFTKAYAVDVEPGCVADICASFSGSAEGGNFWGPTFGWVMGLFAMLLSLACFGLVFKKAKDADELPTIPFLNR